AGDQAAEPPEDRRNGSPDHGAMAAYTTPPMAAPLRENQPVDKRPEAIRGMFARVAPVYDLLNHLLSGSLDHVWRRKSARAVRPDPSASATVPVLDLCCGTGDQAIALGRRRARVAAADFC